MTRSAFETSASHGFTCSSSQAMSHTTNEHLARLDEMKPEYPEGLGTLATRVDQALRMCYQASQGSMTHSHGTKN
jgi:hypothetical protein